MPCWGRLLSMRYSSPPQDHDLGWVCARLRSCPDPMHLHHFDMGADLSGPLGLNRAGPGAIRPPLTLGDPCAVPL